MTDDSNTRDRIVRKVSETVITAFLDGKSKKVDNTYSNGSELYLYGNQIASNTYGVVRIFFASGHSTAITKERLNALLQLMNRSDKYETAVSHIYQKDFEWYMQLTDGSRADFHHDTWYNVGVENR